MKKILAVLSIVGCTLISSNAYARNGLWISNKLTIGYNQAYISTQVDIFQFQSPRHRIELGYIFEPLENLDIVPRYILQLPRQESALEHIFGISLKLTF